MVVRKTSRLHELQAYLNTHYWAIDHKSLMHICSARSRIYTRPAGPYSAWTAMNTIPSRDMTFASPGWAYSRYGDIRYDIFDLTILQHRIIIEAE